MLWHISNWLFSSLPTKNWRDFFSDHHCENLEELLHMNSKKYKSCLGSTGAVNCQVWPVWASSNCQLQFRFPTLILIPLMVSVWGFLLHYVVILCICGSVSKLGSSDLSCDLSSQRDLRRVVDFSVYLVFYLLLEQSDVLELLTLCARIWKLFAIHFGPS